MLHIDFESRSAADLRKVGLDVYAKHPSTDALCMAYAFNDEKIELWKKGKPLPQRVRRHIADGLEVWAHNVSFELAIINNVCAPKYGWPPLKPEQTVCTMVMAYAMGLPGSLENCAAALGISEQKDLAGGRLMMAMSKPKATLPNGKYEWWEDAERLERLYAYCIQDINVERMAGKRMLKLSPYERQVWLLDQKINNLGITVDVKAVTKAVELVESEKARLNSEMQVASGYNIATCTAVQQIKDYLEFFGVSGDSIDKSSVAEHLADPTLPPIARKILELRAEAGKAATAKFETMLSRASSDGRLRGSFQFSGANTRRWAGRGVQLHNLPRGKLKQHEVEDILRILVKE